MAGGSFDLDVALDMTDDDAVSPCHGQNRNAIQVPSLASGRVNERGNNNKVGVP